MKPDRDPDELLTISDILEELQHKVTPQTVSRWCRLGELPARRAGLRWLVRREDFEKFLMGGGSEVKKAEALAA